MVIGWCTENGVDCLEVSNIAGDVVLKYRGMIIACCVCTGQMNSRDEIHCMVKDSVRIWGNIMYSVDQSFPKD